MKLKENVSGFITVVELEGRIDISTVPDLTTKLMNTIKKGNKYLVLDFAAVEYLASAGLRLLVQIVRTLHEVDGQLVLCRLPELISNLLKITGMTDQLVICADQSEAIAKMQG